MVEQLAPSPVKASRAGRCITGAPPEDSRLYERHEAHGAKRLGSGPRVRGALRQHSSRSDQIRPAYRVESSWTDYRRHART